MTFVLTIATMYVIFPTAVQAKLRAFLTTGHVTYTQKINGNMRDKEHRKVIARNQKPLKTSTNKRKLSFARRSGPRGRGFDSRHSDQLEYPQGYSFSYLHSAYHIKQNCTSIAKIFLDAGELLCFLSVCAKILFRQIDASFSRDLLKHT